MPSGLYTEIDPKEVAGSQANLRGGVGTGRPSKQKEPRAQK